MAPGVGFPFASESTKVGQKGLGIFRTFDAFALPSPRVVPILRLDAFLDGLAEENIKIGLGFASQSFMRP